MPIRPLRTPCGLLILLATTIATAQQPPEPSGPHPRLFAEPGTTERLKELAGTRGSAVARAVADCRDIAGSPGEFGRDGYMGLDWARSLQTCLVAWRATGEDRHAQTALIYFKALLDDRTTVGDGKGGDKSATRDSGYAIRALGPYTALAYDWLHDHPDMDEALLARARQRFKAWTDWYVKEGYRASHPGNNYHAGYVAAATLMAIAQGGEAGPDGARLWTKVVDQIFEEQLLPAARDGVLTGGDWGEGWQYGPLSVAEYALAARAVAAQGVDVAPMGQWLEDLFLRTVYAMTPTGERTVVVGDTQSHVPHIHVNRLTLEAVLVGPAPLQAQQWARAEIDRIGEFESDDLKYVLYSALAEARDAKAVPYPRESMGTAYFAPGTSIIYARSGWDKGAVWFAAFCSSTIDVDHLPPNAGNFVLSRGRDHAIVDPSPYGSLSSLTSNAPGIEATGQPDGYVPSQTFWSKDTGFRWKLGLPGGALVARCDYADQWRFREVASPIKLATRDLVLLPYRDESGAESATLLVLDRARTEEPGHGLHLRFRTPVELDQIGNGGAGKLKDSQVSILRLAGSGGDTEVARQDGGDCFNDKKYTRGNCDAARFDIGEVRLVVPGTDADAVFEIDVAPITAVVPKATALAATGGRAWLVERGAMRWVVAEAAGPEALTYRAPLQGATHIVLPAKAAGVATLAVDVLATADDCRISVGGESGRKLPGDPLVFATGAECAVQDVPRTPVPSDVKGLKQAGAAASGTGTAPADPA
jgi:hypothetical protein